MTTALQMVFSEKMHKQKKQIKLGFCELKKQKLYFIPQSYSIFYLKLKPLKRLWKKIKLNRMDNSLCRYVGKYVAVNICYCHCQYTI